MRVVLCRDGSVTRLTSRVPWLCGPASRRGCPCRSTLDEGLIGRRRALLESAAFSALRAADRVVELELADLGPVSVGQLCVRRQPASPAGLELFPYAGQLVGDHAGGTHLAARKALIRDPCRAQQEDDLRHLRAERGLSQFDERRRFVEPGREGGIARGAKAQPQRLRNGHPRFQRQPQRKTEAR